MLLSKIDIEKNAYNGYLIQLSNYYYSKQVCLVSIVDVKERHCRGIIIELLSSSILWGGDGDHLQVVPNQIIGRHSRTPSLPFSWPNFTHNSSHPTPSKAPFAKFTFYIESEAFQQRHGDGLCYAILTLQEQTDQKKSTKVLTSSPSSAGWRLL